MGKNPGKYPALGTLLDALLDFGLDPSWHYFVSWLLLGPDGSNIRNDVAHGFTVGMDEVHAALVLRAASVLVNATGSVVGETKTLTLAQLPSNPASRPAASGRSRAGCDFSNLAPRAHVG